MEKVAGGAGSPPHPPAWLVVAPGMLSAGFKLQEAEPVPSSHAWGFALGHCWCRTAARQPWPGGSPYSLRQGRPWCAGQGALPASQLPWQLRFTLLAPLSCIFLLYTQLLLFYLLAASIAGSSASHHSGRRWSRVGDVPCAGPEPGWSSSRTEAPGAVLGSSQW